MLFGKWLRINVMNMPRIVISLFIIFYSFGLQAQSFNQTNVVTQLAQIMDRNYVFPEKGKAMSDLILSKLKNGEYKAIESPDDLAKRLDADLKSVANDKHIRVTYNPTRFEAIQQGSPTGGRPAQGNYGFEEVDILEGNIGYLDLRGFSDIRFAEEVAKAAMDKLIQSDAIIFDLRKNGGGSPSMIRFISSYLFDDKPVHLNTFYWRPSDRYSETWTAPELASVYKPNVPVYVLTSSYTFSAAEEFTYNLKNLKRATIIGETTGGGAHPGGPMLLTDGFIVNVPQGRAINPITKTNWEGVGVKPNIAIKADAALGKALELIKTKN